VTTEHVFNPPPGWPKPPPGWSPPRGWTPDPSWPEPPPGWQLWLPAESEDTDGDDAYGIAPTEESQDALPAAPQSTRLESDTARADQRIEELEGEVNRLRAAHSDATSDDTFVVLSDEQVLQEVGIYRYHHPLETAVAFKERLDALGTRIAEVVRADQAIEKSNMFTFDNSLAKGRKMSNDLAKLMLRAYNAEADNCVRSLRAGNVVTAKKRLEASRAAIAKLGRMMEMRISDHFHALRVEEVELTSDYLMKKQEEREEAREERERLREERKVAAELAMER
jgi:hypothetical protein